MRYIAALTLALISTPGFATTTCIIEPGSILIKAVAWDTNTKAAKVTDYSGKTREGKLTRISDHEHGKKFNILINYEPSSHENQEAEYIVFQVSPGSFRVIGVTYTIQNGDRFLSSSHGNHGASCITM